MTDKRYTNLWREIMPGFIFIRIFNGIVSSIISNIFDEEFLIVWVLLEIIINALARRIKDKTDDR